MTDHQYAADVAHTEHDETIVFRRMVIILELNRIFIEEYRPGLQEGDTVLLQIRAAFRLIPLERDHTYSVCTHKDLSISGPIA